MHNNGLVNYNFTMPMLHVLGDLSFFLSVKKTPFLIILCLYYKGSVQIPNSVDALSCHVN